MYFLPPTTFVWPLGGWSPVQLIVKQTLLATMGYKSNQMHSVCLIFVIEKQPNLIVSIFSFCLKAPMQLFLAHTPAGCCIQQFFHFAQLIKTGRFQKYDPDFLKNDNSDDASTESDYNLKNVLTPVALYYSDEDWLAVDADIQRLKGELPNVIKDYPIHHKRFNHIDFLCGVDAPRLLYSEILKTIKKSELRASVKNLASISYRLNIVVTVVLTFIVVLLPFLLYYFLYEV